jgi:hypothetical protein
VYEGFVRGIRSALTNGIVDIFTIGIGLGVGAFILTTFLPRVELATWGESPAPEPTPELALAEPRSA